MVNCLLQDIFGAGSHTTAKTMEWAMAELICNPEKMKRAQAELDEIVGRNRRVEESDTERLPLSPCSGQRSSPTTPHSSSAHPTQSR